MVDNIQLYDSLLKQYISSVVSYNGIKIANASALPTGLTYQLDGLTYKFHIGDIVRIPSLNNLSGYAFYRLDNIDNNQPVWSELAEGDLRLPETVTVHIASNQASTTDLQGLTVTVGGTTKTYQGQDLIFLVDQDVQYTITASDVAGYQKVNNSTGTYTALFWGSREATITYNTEVVTLTSSVSDATLTINGDTYTTPVKIAYGTSYTVGGSKTGYTVQSITYTASLPSVTRTVTFEVLVTGTYAITDTGQLVSYSNIDTSNTSLYVGVAVVDIDNNVAFWIDKRFPTGLSASGNVGNYKAWSGSLRGIDLTYLSNIRTGIGDGLSISGGATSLARSISKNCYDGGETGIVNTNNMVNDPNASSDTAANNAAKYCRSIANPIDGSYNGYLGCLFEWIIVNDNQIAINNILNKIGGVIFENNTSGDSKTRWWTSSEYNDEQSHFWYWYGVDPYVYPFMSSYYKDYSEKCYCARPFFPLP